MAGVINMGRIDRQYLDRTLFEHTFRIEAKRRFTVTQVLNGLNTLILEEDIVEIGRTSSLQWNVVVRSDEAATVLRDAGFVDIGGHDTKIINVSQQVVEIRCHWLPGYVKDTFLKFFFSNYGIVKEIKRDTTVIGANKEKLNGVRVVVLETDDLVKSNIPHLIRFEGGISMLITMPGRPPLCLKCSKVGHMRRDCDGQGATFVQQQVRSYASAVRNREPVKTPTVTVEEKETAPEPVHDEVMQDEDETEKESPDDKVAEVATKENEEGEQAQQGVRRPWTDTNDGFDLDNSGQLVIDGYPEDLTTNKRTKIANTLELICGGDLEVG